MELRKADLPELPFIWEIIQQAIEQRRQDGSEQWQQGYPNEQTIEEDITNGWGYVLIENAQVIAYAAIIVGNEPAYENIQGKWLTDGTYVVIHRVATSNAVKGRGVATQLFRMIEELALAHDVYSIRVDTNFDNVPMLKILERLNYVYCGEVFFIGANRMAFEKVLTSVQARKEDH